jgi:UDP-N-acetylglucosamine acyltransferase
MIHASAIVSARAELGEGVVVGPGALIDEGCQIGNGCEIRAHAVITGASQIGKENQIGYGAIIGAEPQDLSFKNAPSRVVIGDHNIIREYATIHRGTEAHSTTEIGNHCLLMAGCHVAHNCRVGNHVILVNNVLLGGHVEVQDRAFLGGGAAVHQKVRIGELSIMRGQTRIGKDLPPFFMAVDTNQVAGLNRVGMRRAGYDEKARREIRAVYDLLYHSGCNVSQALEEIDKQYASEPAKKLAAFIRASKRGICLATPSVIEEE